MRVTFNTQYRTAIASLADQAAEMAVRQREVSSGRRLHALSDDPSAAAALVRLRTDVAAADQYTRTGESAASRLQVMDGVLTELTDLVTQAKAAAMGGLGSAASEAHRETAALQIRGLRDAILTAINTKFGGTYLFAGDEMLSAPYRDAGGAVSGYEGGAGFVDVDVDGQTAVAVTLNARAILQGAEADDVFEALDCLADDVRAGSIDDARAGLDRLNRALASIGSAQGRVGIDLAAITAAGERLETHRLSALAQVSSLEDASLAESAAALARADTAHQATLSALAMSQRLSLLDFLR